MKNVDTVYPEWLIEKGIQFTSKQHQILNKLYNKDPNPIVYCDRGEGKTFALAALSLMWVDIYTPEHSIVFVVSPTYEQSIGSFGKELLKLHSKLGLSGIFRTDTFNLSIDNKMSVVNMSSLKAEDHRSWQGICKPYALVLFDEFQAFKGKAHIHAEAVTASINSRIIVVGS